MATIETNDDFVNACSYLIEQGTLTATGSLYIDANSRIVVDEFDNSDITPDTATLESALDSANAQLAQDETERVLVTFTRDTAIDYFRTELASAAGSSAAIGALYTQARTYEQQNQMLTDTMLTLRTIEETALGASLALTTNQDKARYLKLFLMALALWS